MTELAFRPAATRIALGLLVGLAIVVIQTNLSHADRAHLETISEVTAVGDTHLYPFGHGAPPVTFAGQPLKPAAAAPEEVRETRVLHAGDSEDGAYRIYILHEPAEGFLHPKPSHPSEAVISSDHPTYYLKTGTNQFLKMQP